MKPPFRSALSHVKPRISPSRIPVAYATRIIGRRYSAEWACKSSNCAGSSISSLTLSSISFQTDLAGFHIVTVIPLREFADDWQLIMWFMAVTAFYYELRISLRAANTVERAMYGNFAQQWRAMWCSANKLERCQSCQEIVGYKRYRIGYGRHARGHYLHAEPRASRS